jgi:transcription initiation factor TFIIIB Brf1 subunit/transcription initiation factor TFIIB
VLDARCPECGKKAQVDDEMSKVTCKHCGYVSSYDDYIETMKGKAQSLSDEYQLNLDKNPF